MASAVDSPVEKSRIQLQRASKSLNNTSRWAIAVFRQIQAHFDLISLAFAHKVFQVILVINLRPSFLREITLNIQYGNDQTWLLRRSRRHVQIQIRQIFPSCPHKLVDIFVVWLTQIALLPFLKREMGRFVPSPALEAIEFRIDTVFYDIDGMTPRRLSIVVDASYRRIGWRIVISGA
jgi:hypothetical protein